jgi:hypothetical protein
LKGNLVRHLQLILGASLLEGMRWVREHLYAVCVLGPLVLGMTYLGVGRAVEEAEWAPTGFEGGALSVAAAACLIVMSMSRASAEVYHLRRPEAMLDALPVAPEAHLLAALIRRMVRTSVVAAAAVVLRRFAGGTVLDASLLLPLALFVWVTSAAEVLASLQWIHWGHTRGRVNAAAGLALVVIGALTGGLLLWLVLAPWKWSDAGRVWALAGGALTGVLLSALSVVLHGRWRAADAEYAKRLGAGAARRGLWGRAAWVVRREPPSVKAQLARDLQLTLRGFSSAVYTSAGLAALFVLALAALLGSGWPPEGGGAWAGMGEAWYEATLLPRVLAVKFACVLASAALGAVVPVLVAHQGPHMWLERATGVRGADAWRAKLLLARIVMLPGAVGAWAVGVACGAAPVFYVVPLLAECLWLWWLMSTLVGGLSFEMPEQPGLALVVMTCAAVAAGGFTAFLWPMGLALYAFGMQQLLMRGAQQAHSFLKGADVKQGLFEKTGGEGRE